MEIMKIFKIVALPFFAYILGSIPFGLIIARLFTAVDIREEGSGNIGATNVRRVAGAIPGFLTLFCDVLKGALPVWIALKITGYSGLWNEIYLSIVTVSVFSGHLFPVFMKFKGGGKGVAAAAGSFFVLSPIGCFVAIV